jgi:hypothetical protein
MVLPVAATTAGGFFSDLTAGALIGPALGGVSQLFGGQQQSFLDTSRVQQQMQERQLTQQQAELGLGRVERAGERELTTQQQAARQRVEALDRIIGVFQQNLRI